MRTRWPVRPSPSRRRGLSDERRRGSVTVLGHWRMKWPRRWKICQVAGDKVSPDADMSRARYTTYNKTHFARVLFLLNLERREWNFQCSWFLSLCFVRLFSLALICISLSLSLSVSPAPSCWVGNSIMEVKSFCLGVIMMLIMYSVTLYCSGCVLIDRIRTLYFRLLSNAQLALDSLYIVE